MTEAPEALTALLRAAPPDRLVEVTDEYVRRRLGALRCDLLIADYRITGLWSVLQPAHPSQGSLAERTAAARCFSSQEPIVDDVDDPGVRLHLPVSAWGERIGVLLIDFPDPPVPELVDRSRDVAGDLAVALRGADRSTDRYRRARRRERLTMAAELQWELIPGRSVEHRGFLLAGQLEPAYEVGGDNFDWAVNGDLLTVTALNGWGTGLPASVLTALAVNAMRNGRRSGGDIVEQAELASEAVFAAHRGQRHLATLLMEIDAGTGRLRLVDAGSPHVLRLRGGEVTHLELEQQLPLGMFADTRYEAQELTVQPGDRLFLVSDGVHAATPGGREAYGERSMARAMRATRLQPATEAVGTVMRELAAYHADADLDDDAVIVCIDWRGVSTGPMGMAGGHRAPLHGR